MTNEFKTAQSAINASIADAKVVTVDDESGLRDALAAKCSDSTEYDTVSDTGWTDSFVKYTGTTDEGDDWTVRVRLDRADGNAEADAIADQAIARSLSHTEIVTVKDQPGLKMALLVRCDDNVENEGEEEFWGVDDDGDSWRVHVRIANQE